MDGAQVLNTCRYDTIDDDMQFVQEGDPHDVPGDPPSIQRCGEKQKPNAEQRRRPHVSPLTPHSESRAQTAPSCVSGRWHERGGCGGGGGGEGG